MMGETLHLFSYFLVATKMLMLFLRYTDTVTASTVQTLNYTASYGTNLEKLFTVVMVKDSWFGAYQYCIDNNLGDLVISGARGMVFVYLRHKLFIDGWNNTEFLWTGMVKPVPGTTFYRSTSCLALAPLEAGNLTSDEQQCLLLNMTSDNEKINWLGTSCLNKHFFLCSKRKDKAQYANLTNYEISSVVPNVDITNVITSNSSMTDCIDKCDSEGERFAVVFDVMESMCRKYKTHVHHMPLHVTVAESIMTLNNIVCVKNLSNTIQYIFPDSGYNVTETSEESVPCTPDETTSTPAETTTSTPVETTTSPSTTELMSCITNTTHHCVCQEEQDEVSVEELSLKVEQLKNELMMEKTSLSSYRRKHISAPDERTSAQVIGFAGAFLLAGAILSIVILDLQHFVKFAAHLKTLL